jgi:ParB family chromosome partitioning protein
MHTNPNSGENVACGHLPIRPKSRDLAGEKFGLNPVTISRYIRLTRLIPGLLEQVDAEKIGVIPAVNISYLSEAEQALLEAALAGTGAKLDLKKAEELKYFHERKAKKGGLTDKEILKILKGGKSAKSKTGAVILPKKTYSKFFAEDRTPEEITEIIEKALTLYFGIAEPEKADDNQENIEDTYF